MKPQIFFLGFLSTALLHNCEDRFQNSKNSCKRNIYIGFGNVMIFRNLYILARDQTKKQAAKQLLRKYITCLLQFKRFQCTNSTLYFEIVSEYANKHLHNHCFTPSISLNVPPTCIMVTLVSTHHKLKSKHLLTRSSFNPTVSLPGGRFLQTVMGPKHSPGEDGNGNVGRQKTYLNLSNPYILQSISLLQLPFMLLFSLKLL